ncbi:MAG: hypothetical protein E7486_01775, partial [Ruminococcaceae bacterium]|nr:hypothetical protein [Oscillospiraceae bacterium]
RCQHLSWYTMEGEAKRDYPASIFHQSPWYRDYGKVEDYFARMGLVISQGAPDCDVLLLNPIESVWCQAYIGWANWIYNNSPDIAPYEKRYAEIFHMLTGNQIDFDYGEEEMMARMARVETVAGEPRLYVGQASYKTVIVSNSREVRLKYIDVIRQFRPDIIITHDKDKDYHPDHTTTGQILWDIHVMSTIPNIKTETPPCEKLPELYYMDTTMGVDFAPEFYVDISETFETKAKMLACHKSQDGWMDYMYGVSNAEFARTLARFRGFQGGCTYAECFRKAHFFPGSAHKTVDVFC